jgi:hypothetical protein
MDDDWGYPYDRKHPFSLRNIFQIAMKMPYFPGLPDAVMMRVP